MATDIAKPPTDLQPLIDYLDSEVRRVGSLHHLTALLRFLQDSETTIRDAEIRAAQATREKEKVEWQVSQARAELETVTSAVQTARLAQAGVVEATRQEVSRVTQQVTVDEIERREKRLASLDAQIQAQERTLAGVQRDVRAAIQDRERLQADLEALGAKFGFGRRG